MATTPTYAIPYPLGNELVRDGNDVIQALAQRVEALIAQRDAGTIGRNVIRNGDFGVWARGNGPFTTGYSADGWALDGSGGTRTFARYITAAADSTLLLANSLGILTTSGHSLASDYFVLWAAIEDVRTLAGQQVTLGFYARATTGTPKVAIEVLQNFGTGGSPSASAMTYVSTVQTTAVGTRYTVTFTVPSIAAKTIGTNNNSSLWIGFWLSAGSTYASRTNSLGTQAGAIAIGDVQLEAGPLATPFERLSQQQQAVWCARYFRRYSYANAGTAPHIAAGLAASASMIFFGWKFETPMAFLPAVSGVGVGSSDGVVSNKTGGTIAWNATNYSIDGGLLAYTGFTPAATPHWPEILTLNSAGAYIQFSAEF